MKLEGLSRSRDLLKMAYDRTAGPRIRNLCHFLEKCEAGWKEAGLVSYSKQWGRLVWDEELIRLYLRFARMKFRISLIVYFTYSYYLDLNTKPRFCKF